MPRPTLLMLMALLCCASPLAASQTDFSVTANLTIPANTAGIFGAIANLQLLVLPNPEAQEQGGAAALVQVSGQFGPIFGVCPPSCGFASELGADDTGQIYFSMVNYMSSSGPLEDVSYLPNIFLFDELPLDPGIEVFTVSADVQPGPTSLPEDTTVSPTLFIHVMYGDVEAIPEPATSLLAAVSLAALCLRRFTLFAPRVISLAHERSTRVQGRKDTGKPERTC